MASSSGSGEGSVQNRPPDLDDAAVLHSTEEPSMQRYPSDGAGSKAETPAGMSSSSTAGTTVNIISTGDINEFQMYQKFRLKMVQMFGSLASALYEFGADPETGRISRTKFEEVCTGGLNIMSLSEANLLFSHVTNADPMDLGFGGFATYRDFSINDAEWKQLIHNREQQKQGIVGGLPFASGPSGASMGIYHRPMKINTVNDAGGEQGSTPKDADGSFSGGLTGTLENSKLSVVRGHSSRRTPRKKGEPYAWRARQKPWIGSIYAGEDQAMEAEKLKAQNAAQRGRPCEFTFRSAGKVALQVDHPKHAQLGASPRKTALDIGHLVQQCPPRRREMEPEVCVKQVDDWWPYSARAPPRKLPITLPRCNVHPV